MIDGERGVDTIVHLDVDFTIASLLQIGASTLSTTLYIDPGATLTIDANRSLVNRYRTVVTKP